MSVTHDQYAEVIKGIKEPSTRWLMGELHTQALSLEQKLDSITKRLQEIEADAAMGAVGDDVPTRQRIMEATRLWLAQELLKELGDVK